MAGLPLIVGVESGEGLAQESKYHLAAARGSWGRRRGAEQDCGFQPHSRVFLTLGDELLTEKGFQAVGPSR